jgi:hypothetical protein
MQTPRVEGVIGQLQLTPLLAGDPARALQLLERHRPVLAVVDLNMSMAEDGSRSVSEAPRTDLAKAAPEANIHPKWTTSRRWARSTRSEDGLLRGRGDQGDVGRQPSVPGTGS